LEEYKIEYGKLEKAIQTFLSLMAKDQHQKYLNDKLKDRMLQKAKAEVQIKKLEDNLPKPGSKEPPSKKTLALIVEQKEYLAKLELEIAGIKSKL